MTKLDARYREALPEFPLFEIGDEGETPAQQAARVVAAAGAPRFKGHAATIRVVTPALIEVDEVEIDPAPVVGEAEAALAQAAEARATLADAIVVEVVGLEPALVDAVAVEAAEIEAEGADAPSTPLPEWTGCVAVFDLETTGIDTDTARIVSAHVGVLDDCGVVVERKDWLVDPGVEIPDGASAVHGISTARVRRYGRPAAEVIPEILDAIRSVERRGLPLVIYNAPYDLTLLTREAQRHGLAPLDGTGLVIDPLVLDKALDRYRKGKRTLEVTAALYGVELTEAHSAGADAIAAGRLAQAMAARYPVELGVELERLHSMQVHWCREQAERFADYMRRTKDPSFTTSGAWPSRC